MNNSDYIYFDVASTTPVNSVVLDKMHEINKNYFGNSSSIHQIGQKAHNLIERSRKNIASLLGCLESEIIFTSGGTESNNMALRGILSHNDHFITSTYEHPSILNVAKSVEKKGVEVTYIKPNKHGIIEIDDIKNAIKKNTKLISIMFLNNELGSINPIEEISLLCNHKSISFHTDAVQYIGKGNINLENSTIDLLSLGAHKFYGPKGIGALYIKKGIDLSPVIFGGGQENGYRPGTESVSLIAGMCEALKIAFKNLDKNKSHIKHLESLFFHELDQTNISYTLNGGERMDGFLNITFHEVDGQALLMNLDMNGIAVSFGSACSSGSAKASNALLEIGLDKKSAKETIRISIGDFITEENILSIIKSINEIISKEIKEKQYV